MTPTEAVALCRATKAACPQQQFDQWTPDAWHELLADLPLGDAKEAMIQVARRQPFVAPSEIRAELRRLQRQRLSDYGPLPLPPARVRDLEDGPLFDAAYQQWVRDSHSAIAAGRAPETDDTPEIVQWPTRAVIDGLRRSLSAGRSGKEATASPDNRHQSC